MDDVKRTGAESANDEFRSSALSSFVVVFMAFVFVFAVKVVRESWATYQQHKGDEGIVDFVFTVGTLLLAEVVFAVVAVTALRSIAAKASSVSKLIVLTTVPATVVISLALARNLGNSIFTLIYWTALVSAGSAAIILAFMSKREDTEANGV